MARTGLVWLVAIIPCALLGCGPQREIHDAIESGGVASVRKHLERGYDANRIDGESYADGQMLQSLAEFCAQARCTGSATSASS